MQGSYISYKSGDVRTDSDLYNNLIQQRNGILCTSPACFHHDNKLRIGYILTLKFLVSYFKPDYHRYAASRYLLSPDNVEELPCGSPFCNRARQADEPEVAFCRDPKCIIDRRYEVCIRSRIANVPPPRRSA